MEKDILELFKQGYSFSEIQSKLNLTCEDMSVFLTSINDKIYSHYHHIKFYENGNRRYSPNLILDTGIITNKDSESYKAMVISDTHFGSISENKELLDTVYDYCIKNNIHNIYHLGDVIDGITGKPEAKYLNPEEQVSHVINDYPSDSGILNFVLLGNHDLDIIGSNYPLHDAITSNRKDMVCLGYGTREIFIKNDSFILKHSILIDKTDNNYSKKLIFRGHSHQMKLVDNLNNYYIYAPSLSNLQFIDGVIPGFLTIEYGFHNGYINECIINHYGIIDNKIINMNVNRINLKGRKREEIIEREEVLVKLKH